MRSKMSSRSARPSGEWGSPPLMQVRSWDPIGTSVLRPFQSPPCWAMTSPPTATQGEGHGSAQVGPVRRVAHQSSEAWDGPAIQRLNRTGALDHA